MDILHLLNVQSKLVPELYLKFNKRHEILLTIKINQPVGRKTLVNILNMTERVLRTECDILTKLGLIHKSSIGMSVSDKGEEFLLELKQALGILDFEKEQLLIKNKFNLKDVVISKGSFTNNETTKIEMVKCLFDKINALLTKDDVVGVNGGTTMNYVASQVDEVFGYGKNITITPIRGGLTVTKQDIQSNNIAIKMATNSNNKYQILHAPDNITTTILTDLVKEPIVKQALDTIYRTSIIIHSVGNALEMAKRRKSSEKIKNLLKQKNAKSESFGSYFDESGKEVYKALTIGMSNEDVKNVANVFTIVGGVEKAEAVYSYLNSKPKNTTLIIDEEICKELILKIK